MEAAAAAGGIWLCANESHLPAVRLKRCLQCISELTQLFSLAIVILFNLQKMSQKMRLNNTYWLHI